MPFSDIQSMNIGDTARLESNTRSFEGDGTALLKTPHLKKVQSVRIGDMVIPMEITYVFPKNASQTEFESATEPAFDLRTIDGETVLLRNHLSNDGLWQKGVKVFVTGEWADAPKAK